MLSLSAFCFAMGSVALASRSSRPRQAGALALGICALLVSISALGPLRGVICTLVFAMTCASGLVLLLAPRPRVALPVASISAGVGLLLAAVHAVQA